MKKQLNKKQLKKLVEVAKEGCNNMTCMGCVLAIPDGCMLGQKKIFRDNQKNYARQEIKKLLGGAHDDFIKVNKEI